MNNFHLNNIEKFSQIYHLIEDENSIILFEYTSDFFQTKLYLSTQNIKYTLLNDNTNLEFIIIE